MNRRIELQYLLEKILGSKNVYYQPPENIKMIYPAIVYSRQDINNKYANNNQYIRDDSYQLILIDKKPDNNVINELLKLNSCSFNRHYIVDNLNHYTFTLYY